MDVDNSGNDGADDEGDNDMDDAGHTATQELISKHVQRRTEGGTLIPRVALIGSIQDQNNGK
jgi:hypothetical protein